MRLQVQVYLSDAGLGTKPLCNFLEIAPCDLTLEDLSISICKRYRRLYPHRAELRIHKLQDSECNDLDLSYTVLDVFSDKSANKTESIVRVIQVSNIRESSIPPESALRSQSWVPAKRRQYSSQISHLERIEESPKGLHLEPSAKRRRIRELDGLNDSLTERYGTTIDGERHRWLGDDDADTESLFNDLQNGIQKASLQRSNSPELGAQVHQIPVPVLVSQSIYSQITASPQLSGRLKGIPEPDVNDESHTPSFSDSRNPTVNDHTLSSRQQNLDVPIPNQVPSQSQHQSSPSRHKPSLNSNSTISSASRQKPLRKNNNLFEIPSTDDEDPLKNPSKQASEFPKANGIASYRALPSPSLQLESEFRRSMQSSEQEDNQGPAVKKNEGAPIEQRKIGLNVAAADEANNEKRGKETSEVKQYDIEFSEKQENAEHTRLAKEQVIRLERVKPKENAKKAKQMKQEKERTEKVKQEKEKIELAKQEKEKAEKARQEKEKAEQAKKDKEKAEHAKKELEKAEQLKQKETKRKADQEKKEAEKKAREEKTRLAKEKRAKEAEERKKKKEAEQERLRREREEKKKKSDKKPKAREPRKTREKKGSETAEKEQHLSKEAQDAGVKSNGLEKTSREHTIHESTSTNGSTDINKKPRIDSPDVSQTLSSLESVMEPPPIPNSAVKRSNLKDSSQLKKKASVTFSGIRDSPMSTPIPINKTPFKQTPIICPLPQDVGKPKQNNVEDGQKFTTEVASSDIAESSGSGSEGSEQESESSESEDKSTLKHSTIHTSYVSRSPPTSQLSTIQSHSYLSEPNLNGGSDIEMDDAPPSAQPQKSLPLEIPSHKRTFRGPAVLSDSESVNGEGAPTAIKINPVSTPIDQLAAPPMSVNSSGESGSESEFESDPDSDSDSDPESKTVESGLKSPASKSPRSANLVAPPLAKFSTLERLEGAEMQFDVRDPHASSSHPAPQSSQTPLATKRIAGDDGSSGEDGSSESGSDSDSGSDGDDDKASKAKAHPATIIPHHKKAGAVKNKPSAMGFGRRFLGAV